MDRARREPKLQMERDLSIDEPCAVLRHSFAKQVLDAGADLATVTALFS